MYKMATIYTVLGSLNYDLVTMLNRVPNGGETIQAENFETHIGGKGLNQCISISKLSTSKQGINIFPSGVEVRLSGSVGDDGFGKEVLNYLSQFPIELDNLSVLKGINTGVAVILIERETGENRIMITPGANENTGSVDLEKVFPLNDDEKGDHFVVLQNEIPNIPETIKWLGKNRSSHIIVYNPSPIYDYSAECLSNVDVLIVNEGEAISLLKSLNLDPADTIPNQSDAIDTDWFLKLAIVLNHKIRSSSLNLVVITLGSYGSVYSCGQGISVGIIPPEKVSNIIDTTGAGDTFLGGLLTSIGSTLQSKKYCPQYDPINSLKFATTASGITIQNIGASESMPYFDDVINKM